MAISYSINLEEEGRAFPHYWELSVGSCHAATILRADVQEQIKKAHRDIGFQYLRFHGLLDDDMSVVIPPLMPGMGEAQISFFNIDRIFDFLLDIGMKPFVELGFMPEAYASTGQTTFHYRGFSSMPKRDEDWIDLIDKLVRHLEERYGEEEVAYNHDIEERDIKEEDMEIRLQGCICSVKKAVIDADTTAPRLTFTAKSESVTIFKITLA